jgi:hypothetical protein
VVRRGREVPGIGRRAQRAEAGVDLLATHAVECPENPVADPLEHGHVARHARVSLSFLALRIVMLIFPHHDDILTA